MNHVVPHEELLPFAQQLASDIATVPSAAVRRMLQTYDDGALRDSTRHVGARGPGVRRVARRRGRSRRDRAESAGRDRSRAHAAVDDLNIRAGRGANLYRGGLSSPGGGRFEPLGGGRSALGQVIEAFAGSADSTSRLTSITARAARLTASPRRWRRRQVAGLALRTRSVHRLPSTPPVASTSSPPSVPRTGLDPRSATPGCSW